MFLINAIFDFRFILQAALEKSLNLIHGISSLWLLS